MAFTLTEALVCIVILGVLIAVLFTTSKVIREKTQGVQCMQNLRQLGQILLTYSTDHQQTLLPGIRYDSEMRNDGPPWYFELDEKGYLPAASWEGAQSSIMRCPTRAAQGEAAPTLWYRSLNYGMNFFPGVINATDPHTGPVRLSQIRHPHRTALAAEVKDQYLLYPWENPHTAYPHDGSLNIVFVDGHVEAVKGPIPAVIYSPSTADHILVEDPFPFF